MTRNQWDSFRAVERMLRVTWRLRAQSVAGIVLALLVFYLNFSKPNGWTPFAVTLQVSLILWWTMFFAELADEHAQLRSVRDSLVELDILQTHYLDVAKAVQAQQVSRAWRGPSAHPNQLQ